MTDRGAPCSLTYNGALCWASTDLMKEGGKLLTGSRKDMIRSCWRVKSKLSTDGVGEFNGPPVEEFEDCSNVQKRLICYHKSFGFFMVLGVLVLGCHFHPVVYSEYKINILTLYIRQRLMKHSSKTYFRMVWSIFSGISESTWFPN